MTLSNSAKRKIRVCHIITKLELGGAQQVTLDTLRLLDSDQFEKHLISNDEGILIPQAKEIPHLNTYFIPELIREINPYKDLRAYVKIRKVFRQIAPEIVHTHSSKAGILGRLAAKRAGVPVIFHTYHGYSFHDFQGPAKRNFYIMLERIAAKRSTHLYAVSKENIEKGIIAKIFKPGICKLTRDAVHIDLFRKEKPDPIGVKKEFNIPEECRIVGMIACFKPQKSPLDFIYIAKKISEMRDDITFLLVGDGILREKIEKLLHLLDLEKRVILTGWREDVPRLMKAFDVMVLTSLHEGLPMVVPQAMASGVPVVVTNVDGARDIIENNFNGFLVEPRDIESFCGKILTLIDNPGLGVEFTRRGLSVVDEFDIHRMVKSQGEFYQKVFFSMNAAK